MTTTIFKYLSYLGLVLGVILSFWVLRWGALCFLFSIACAHQAGTSKADAHANDVHETLFVVLSMLNQVNKKIDDLNANPRATPRSEGEGVSENESETKPVRRLREYRDA